MISFFVPGVPATAGSKTPVQNRATGKLYVRDSCASKNKWMREIATVARMACKTPLDGCVELRLDFFMPRPDYHYTKIDGKRVLRNDAPYWHTTTPDGTKMVRCAEDALKGIAWHDDKQVVIKHDSKRYAEEPGVLIRITSVSSQAPAIVDPLIRDLLNRPIAQSNKTKPRRAAVRDVY
jgi:Holliday junction resolvase RusA-like endonuclease